MAAKRTARRHVVARRTFRTTKGERVMAVLYRPVMVHKEEWRCDFRISGLSHQVDDCAYGVDGLQAIIIALQGIRFHLDRAPESMTWCDGPVGELGLPRPIPDSYGLDVEKRLAKVVGEEVSRLVDEKVRARRKRGYRADRDRKR